MCLEQNLGSKLAMFFPLGHIPRFIPENIDKESVHATATAAVILLSSLQLPDSPPFTSIVGIEGEKTRRKIMNLPHRLTVF